MAFEFALIIAGKIMHDQIRSLHLPLVCTNSTAKTATDCSRESGFKGGSCCRRAQVLVRIPPAFPLIAMVSGTSHGMQYVQIQILNHASVPVRHMFCSMHVHIHGRRWHEIASNARVSVFVCVQVWVFSLEDVHTHNCMNMNE